MITARQLSYFKNNNSDVGGDDDYYSDDENDDDDDWDVWDVWYNDNAGYDGWKHIDYKGSHNTKS